MSDSQYDYACNREWDCERHGCLHACDLPPNHDGDHHSDYFDEDAPNLDDLDPFPDAEEMDSDA